MKLELPTGAKNSNEEGNYRMNRLSVSSTKGISVYAFGQHDISVLQRNIGRAFMSLTMLSETNPSEFSETTFEISENVTVVEVYETPDSNMFKQPYLRVLAIRDNEEVLCYEVHRKGKQHVKTTKIFNRSDRTDFRWPFYAYAINNS